MSHAAEENTWDRWDTGRIKHFIHSFPKALMCFAVTVPGRRYGVTNLGPEVVSFVSHATQQRLQTLLENVSQAAQQKNLNFKVGL